jgi:hypothetical protein
MNAHGSLGYPLGYYVPQSRRVGDDEPITVDEVDTLWWKGKMVPCDWLVGSPCGLLFLAADLPQPLAAQLPLVERVDLDQFVLERHRAPAPITVTKRQLVKPNELPDSLLLSRP